LMPLSGWVRTNQTEENEGNEGHQFQNCIFHNFVTLVAFC